MKKLVFLFSPLMMLFLFACTKDILEKENIPGLGTVSTLKAASGTVIQVLPSGGDDTYNLAMAFNDAKAAGPGSTVQLVAGEYHIGYMLVEEFVGSFTGAGMGKSLILPLTELPYVDFYNLGLGVELLKFLRGNVKISNMSFLNLQGEPIPGDDLWSFLGLHDWAHNELPDLPENHEITAIVDHVEFVSNLDPEWHGWTPYAVQAAIGCGPDFYWDYNLPYCTVDVTVTNCTFKDLNWAMTCGMNGNEKGRIVFKDNGPVSTNSGIWIIDNLGGSTLISGNKFYTPAWGNSISITDAAWNVNEFKLSDGAQYEISGNEFHATDAWGAVTIANDRKAMGIIDNKNPVLVQIKSNLFDLKGDVWAGIWNWITDDAVIMNNKFTGNAKTGIYVDPRSTNSLMLGNNFSNLVCSKLELWDPLIFDEGYKIILCGNNNTVVGGGNNSTTVLNLGENNKITGAKIANEGADPLGQTIADNFRIWKENLVKIRKH